MNCHLKKNSSSVIWVHIHAINRVNSYTITLMYTYSFNQFFEKMDYQWYVYLFMQLIVWKIRLRLYGRVCAIDCIKDYKYDCTP